MGNIGMRELIIILLVVLLVFGAKKLRTIGSDLGAAVRGFKKSMNEAESAVDAAEEDRPRQLRSEGQDAEFAEAKAAAEQKSDRRSA